MPYFGNQGIPREFPGNFLVVLVWGVFSTHIKQGTSSPQIADMGNNR